MGTGVIRVAVLLAGLAPAAYLAAAHAEDDAAALARLKQEITKAVGDGFCRDVVFCRVLGMGFDPCGNPSVWVAYNNAPGLKEVLETKAAEYTFIEEELQRGRPRTAQCKSAVPPKAACVNSRCTTGEQSY